MIQDISYSQNHAKITSINHSIDPNAFPTTWGTFKATVTLILSLPPGCIAATFNISTAYCLTLIWPSQQHYLCVLWRDLIYVDQAVMFHLSSSTGVFRAIADMLVLVALYKVTGFSKILKWVNNSFLLFAYPTRNGHDFTNLTATFGILWSTNKMRPFTIIQQYIGFD